MKTVKEKSRKKEQPTFFRRFHYSDNCNSHGLSLPHQETFQSLKNLHWTAVPECPKAEQQSYEGIIFPSRPGWDEWERMTGALQKPDLRAETGFNPDIPLVLQKRIKTCESAQNSSMYTEGRRGNTAGYFLMLFFGLTWCLVQWVTENLL